MPRKSRKKGPLNYYHIIIRGNMKQISRVTGINIGVIKQVKSELNDKK